MRAGPGWLPAGSSGPSPPTPTPLPLEFFHSAAPKRRRGGRMEEGDGACKTPKFRGNKQSSLRVKENFGGGCVSGAELTGPVNHGLSFPSLPSPSIFSPFLPPFPRGTDTAPARTGLAAPWKHGGHRATQPASPCCRGAGGETGPRSSSSSPCAPLLLRLGKPGGPPGGGRRGKPNLESAPSPGAGRGGQHRRFRPCSSEQTAPGACGARGKVGGL